jgi:TRAP-type C4-dicarboxylate transport system permease small subunit
VTLVLQKLPPAWRGVFEAWCLLAATALAAGLAWYAVKMVWVSRATNDVSQGSDATPLWLPQIAMALGCVGLLVALLDAGWCRLRGRPFFAAEGGSANVE